MQKNKWEYRKGGDQDKALELSRTYGIPPLVANILLKRGVTDFDPFLYPDTSKLYDPFLMKGMREAVARIIRAIESGETITVYGDYDADGITSTAILVRFLRLRGAQVDYYIPGRLQEGYGVNNQAIETIAGGGSTLLITVDCGITATAEVEHAKTVGLDVIVTDHHECKDEIPDAVAVLNPKQKDCSYPFEKLAGVGVVFKLLQALCMELKLHLQELFDETLDLVAIGTVADVMPLLDENRILVKNGLEQISYTQNKGLKALAKQAEISLRDMTTGTIGYGIAPRINAAGRVGDPRCAVELLLATEDRCAEELARELDIENKNRQASEQLIFEEATSILSENPALMEAPVLVLAHEGWHHGIIGIVASKMTERFHKPCILISLHDGVGKGSGRSIKPFNLFAALDACRDDLIKFGGHDLAAGLTLPEEKIEDFRKHINAHAESMLEKEDFIPVLTLDAELPLLYMNLNTVDKLSVMAPYGMANPNPVFVCRNLTVTGIRVLSEGKHIRLTLSDGTYTAYAIGFSMGALGETIKLQDKVDIVFTLDINVYRGEQQVQIQLRDLRRVQS